MVNTVSIKKNNEFLRTYKKGKFFVGKFIVLYVRPNGSASNRLGITVSKKVGGSVNRNRRKRLIKENYRLLEKNIRCGNDFVFVARESAVLPSFIQVKKEMSFLLKKLDVLV